MRLRVFSLLLSFAAGAASAATYELPADGSDVVGEIKTVVARYEDTLIDIARAHGVGYQDIVRANPGVDVWLPGEGTEVVIPTRFVLPPGPRNGIVLNLAEYRLYYFPQPRVGEAATVMTFPVSIGRQDWETPLGLTRVVAKAVNPAWYPPQSVRDEHAAEGTPLPAVVPPGPDNPLGSRAMRLGLPGYLIHGTNRPAGVGMRVTHGCVRMFPEDIEFLFDYIAVNTPVRIINEPVKFGWLGDELLIEVHPVLASGPLELPAPPAAESAPATEDASEVAQSDAEETLTGAENAQQEEIAVAETAPLPPQDPLAYVTESFVAATSERAGELDWSLVEAAAQRADGLPVAVGRGIKNAATSAAFH